MAQLLERRGVSRVEFEYSIQQSLGLGAIRRAGFRHRQGFGAGEKCRNSVRFQCQGLVGGAQCIGALAAFERSKGVLLESRGLNIMDLQK